MENKLKVYIFEPHPDDLLFGPGPIILDWIEDTDFNINIITVTDGRACFRAGDDKFDDDVATMTEDDVALMRISEAKEAVKFLGIPESHHFLFNFHDADGPIYVEEGINKAQTIIKDADRLFIPSNNNRHADHQATHDIAVGAAKELNLTDTEYFVYFVPSYGKFQEDSKEKQFNYTISEERAEVLKKWLDIYQSQAKIKFTWKMYNRFLRKIRTWTYGIFKFEDIGKYYNF